MWLLSQISWQLGMNMTDKDQIPNEINDHFHMFSKEAWEVCYGDECAVCNSRIDEYGLCACDTMGGD